MKYFLFYVFISFPIFSYSQNKVISKTENSLLLKGSIKGKPIRLFVENQQPIECNLYDTFIKGWYQYDDKKIKIPLLGFSNDCDVKLFNFGDKHKTTTQKLKLDELFPRIIDSTFLHSNYKEALVFDRCHYPEKKQKNLTGQYLTKTSKTEIKLNSQSIFIGRLYEYFILPNGKKLDLMELFTGYGGNNFYSMTEDKTENRIIFNFVSESNHNCLGLCGASEGEYGYHIIYFDKKWNVLDSKTYFTESCLNGVYDTKVLGRTNSEIRYKINNEMSETAKTPYILTVNWEKSTITKGYR